MYKAEIIADSLSPQGNRLTTMKITFPRFILAEFNTHRMFSRNSASSRAIPFNKMVKMVEENPFIPIAWQKDHKGMQGSEYETDKGNILYLEHKWRHGLNGALDAAKRLNMSKVTKQLCNRLLEPFMWHTVIVTSGKEGLKNFFNLRCPQYEYKLGAETYYFKSWKELITFIKSTTDNKDYIKSWEDETVIGKFQYNKGQGEIHIQAIAELMYDAYNESVPKELKAGKFHLPFIEIEENL